MVDRLSVSRTDQVEQRSRRDSRGLMNNFLRIAIDLDDDAKRFEHEASYWNGQKCHKTASVYTKTPLFAKNTNSADVSIMTTGNMAISISSLNSTDNRMIVHNSNASAP